MNPNNIYRIYINKESNQVVVLSVDNRVTEYPPCNTLEGAYALAHNMQKMCEEASICVEVYDGIDEAKNY